MAAANPFAAFFIHLCRMKWVCHNGEMLPEGQPLFTAANRSFRYGDGLFETGKVFQARLLLAHLHFHRLFKGLQLLGIPSGKHFTPTLLEHKIVELCAKNEVAALARVRLAVYRSGTGEADYVIETFPLSSEAMQWNQKGWQLTVYPLARKSCDAFANLKSANYLPYILAAQYAAEKRVDEALVLNTYNHLADGSKTNLFLLIDNEWYTSALEQGCVAGVMRQHLIDHLKGASNVLHQTQITHHMLLAASEVFCTNAIQGIRWVASVDGKQYDNPETKKLFAAFLKKEGYYF